MGHSLVKTILAQYKTCKSKYYKHNYSKKKWINVNKKYIVNRNHFDFLYVIGKGTFGKIWKVIYKKTKNEFALKEMSKVKIVFKNSLQNILFEKELLSKLRHKFMCNLIDSFQDNDNL